MLGIAVRTAQRMGIHSETANSRHSILEAEMRRRLWWSLILFDARISELADYKTSSLSPTWDCRIPLNLNDSELQPEMRAPPENQSRPTETLFAVIRSEMGDYIRHTDFHLDFTNPALKSVEKSKHDSLVDKSEISELEKLVQEKYIRLCDAENPLHFMTIYTVRGYLARFRLVEFYSQCSTPDAQATEAQRDEALNNALIMLDCDTKITTSPLTRRYGWVADFNFPFLAYIQIALDLKRRPTNIQTERAWETMNENFEARFNTAYDGRSPFFQVFSKVILEAWEARKLNYPQMGEELPPRIVACILQNMESIKKSPGDRSMVQGGKTTMIEGYNDLSMPMPASLINGFPTGAAFNYNPLPTSNINVGHTPLENTMNQLNWSFMDWTLDRPQGW
jgi:Fungal specific transcription factor domain